MNKKSKKSQTLSGTPLFNCTATMLEACGYATWETPDPSGRYVFFQVSPDNALIAKIELAQQKRRRNGKFRQRLRSRLQPG
jgi:hypothetical protein